MQCSFAGGCFLSYKMYFPFVLLSADHFKKGKRKIRKEALLTSIFSLQNPPLKATILLLFSQLNSAGFDLGSYSQIFNGNYMLEDSCLVECLIKPNRLNV